MNSIENHPEISQYEIDYYRGNPYSTALGELSKALSKKLDNETKIFADEYDEAFRVTKEGIHPSVLIEMGYATNEADAKNLNSQEWREGFCKTLADCIIDWVANYEEN